MRLDGIELPGDFEKVKSNSCFNENIRKVETVCASYQGLYD